MIQHDEDAKEDDNEVDEEKSKTPDNHFLEGKVIWCRNGNLYFKNKSLLPQRFIYTLSILNNRIRLKKFWWIQKNYCHKSTNALVIQITKITSFLTKCNVYFVHHLPQRLSRSVMVLFYSSYIQPHATAAKSWSSSHKWFGWFAPHTQRSSWSDSSFDRTPWRE